MVLVVDLKHADVCVAAACASGAQVVEFNNLCYTHPRALTLWSIWALVHGFLRPSKKGPTRHAIDSASGYALCTEECHDLPVFQYMTFGVRSTERAPNRASTCPRSCRYLMPGSMTLVLGPIGESLLLC